MRSLFNKSRGLPGAVPDEASTLSFAIPDEVLTVHQGITQMTMGEGPAGTDASGEANAQPVVSDATPKPSVAAASAERMVNSEREERAKKMAESGTPARISANRKGQMWGALTIVLSVAALALSGLPAFTDVLAWRGLLWVAVMSILFLAFITISKATTQYGRALWVDDRYMMNLARVQVTLWTLLIVSAYLTAAVSNTLIQYPSENDKQKAREALAKELQVQGDALKYQKDHEKATDIEKSAAGRRVADSAERVKKAEDTVKNLDAYQPKGSLIIAIPPTVWILLGISIGSWLGSPLILNNKKAQESSEADFTKAKEGLKAQGASEAKIAQVETQGRLLINTAYDQAAFSDLFRGEETGNAATLDVGKVQMFYFTVIVLFVYATGLFKMFNSGLPIHEFPDLDSSIVTLLGISNASYLANKAVPHGEPPKTRPA
jgi:hypothetical protein